MTEQLIGFGIWALCGVLLIALGIRCFFAKEPVGIWANAKRISVKEGLEKAYNAAVGKLFCTGGAVFVLLGLPLLSGRNSAGVILSILGAMFGAILMMAVSVRIEEKYREKKNR